MDGIRERDQIRPIHQGMPVARHEAIILLDGVAFVPRASEALPHDLEPAIRRASGGHPGISRMAPTTPAHFWSGNFILIFLFLAS